MRWDNEVQDTACARCGDRRNSVLYEFMDDGREIYYCPYHRPNFRFVELDDEDLESSILAALSSGEPSWHIAQRFDISRARIERLSRRM